MTKRFDVCSPRPRKDSDKPYWHRVGTAFEGEKGMNLVFDSLPLPDKDGRVSVFLFEPKEKTIPAAKTDGKSVTARRSSADMGRDDEPGRRVQFDDEIPFLMEWRG